MLDLKLVDIFSTICTGIITTALITYFYFIFNKFFIKDKFDNEAFTKWIKARLAQNYSQSGYAILLVVIVYCLGIIGGDLTERMTDSDDVGKNMVLKELRWVSRLKKEGQTRLDAIYHTEGDSALTGLGKSIFRTRQVLQNANQLAGTHFFDGREPLDQQWNALKKEMQESDSIKRKFDGFVQQIYYTGKNWTYFKNNEPLNELKSIQNRIDLSRSMVLLVTFSLQLLLLFVLINLAAIIISRRREISNWLKKPKEQVLNKMLMLAQAKMLLLLFVILFISRTCYIVNEANFNKRAYGYYVSDVQRIEYEKELKADSVSYAQYLTAKTFEAAK